MPSNNKRSWAVCAVMSKRRRWPITASGARSPGWGAAQPGAL
jgi:hypothetical protein